MSERPQDQAYRATLQNVNRYGQHLSKSWRKLCLLWDSRYGTAASRYLQESFCDEFEFREVTLTEIDECVKSFNGSEE